MVALGMAADKIMVHYTGLDHSRFRPVPRAEARAAAVAIAPKSDRLLVTVGNLVPLKGQHLVIQALQQLPDTRLVLAGSGPEESSLRALAGQLGLDHRVHFAGSVQPDQLAVLLSAADIMVLPSEREGLANAWVEALACGTPLVITDAGGAREVVRDASAGQIVDRSVAGIVAGVQAILANPPTQAEAAASAAQFSWDGNAEKLADYYQRLVRR
jgi:glycosyltransferase involved in cell wall biosynthesis